MSLLQDKIDHLQWWLDTIGFEKVYSSNNSNKYKFEKGTINYELTIYSVRESICKYNGIGSNLDLEHVQSFKVKDLIKFLENRFEAEIRKGKIKEILK